ncbi:MAG: 4Fe-4S dicluster domain-containing protein [Ignavibacteriales bacterium]|nr:4Fe-4S dicluster domain-containing protein [Ignavibacteriales bacterium]
MAEETVATSAPVATKPPAPKAKKKPKELAVVNQEGCTGCEVCVEFCPVDCILVVAGPEYDQHKKLVEIDLDICIGCKLCVKYCPWETIEMLPNEVAYETAASPWTQRTVLSDRDWMANASAELAQETIPALLTKPFSVS